MAEILYSREWFLGPKIELHMAREGLTLVGRGGQGAVEYAPITDVSGVAVDGGGRPSLMISFGSARTPWIIRRLQRPVADWAKAVIDEETTAIEKSGRAEFSSRVPLEMLQQNCENVLASSNGRAAVDIVDLTLIQAVLHGASDVHYDPFADSVVVRYRLDGVLQDVAKLDASMKRQLTARLKVVSHLATFKNAVAQEGRAAVRVGDRTVDFRFSSIPTIHGEKINVRVFDPKKSIFQIDKLGMPAAVLDEFTKTITQPQGTVLLTGPAGSGKTTTMYASLSYLRENKKSLSSIATVEDPVEYDLRVVNQTQVNTNSGLTFANALRTVLRQDPEVIMIGEIRDPETADIAVQAGLTGHMVLSTVHARSAAGVLLRLIDLGVEPFLVASSVTAVLSQRLVRVVCQDCARHYEPTEEQRAKYRLLGSDRFVSGAGCQKCGGTGHIDRTGIFQLLPVSDVVRDLLLKRVSLNELEAQIEREDVKSLLQDGLEKARAGVTTLEEIERVLG